MALVQEIAIISARLAWMGTCSRQNGKYVKNEPVVSRHKAIKTKRYFALPP
jgi:hypothetical protein